MCIKDEERNGRTYLEYNPIDNIFRDILLLATGNLHDNLPNDVRKYGNFKDVLQERALFHSLT